jgi:hypothetical protein
VLAERAAVDVADVRERAEHHRREQDEDGHGAGARDEERAS